MIIRVNGLEIDVHLLLSFSFKSTHLEKGVLFLRVPHKFRICFMHDNMKKKNYQFCNFFFENPQTLSPEIYPTTQMT